MKNSPATSSAAVLAPVRIRTVIIDDEPAARRGIRLLLERDPAIDVIGEAADGHEAFALLERERPDLAFLDIQMPGCDGFQVLNRIGTNAAPAVVFVTAYDEHALRAFEVNAVDYLLKPYDDARFVAALERAKTGVYSRQRENVNAKLGQLLDYLQTTPPSAEPQTVYSERILLKTSGEIYFLKADEIDWIEAEGDYMKFHVAGKAHLLRETMARLEVRLDPQKFIRIHRSTIVNLDRVRKLSPSFVGEYAVILQDGTKLKLSRGYHDRLASLLKNAL